MKKSLLGLFIILSGVLLSFFILLKSTDPGNQASKESLASELHEASFYKQVEGGKVQCQLCPNRCLLQEKQRGLCKVRENIGGKLYSLVYGKPVTVQLDPIEKKPIFHFLPGSQAYSLATAGCNLSCKYCQNWDISQRQPEDLAALSMTPEEVVNQTRLSGAQIIAFTYNEPIVWYEYLLDIAQAAKKQGLRTVMVSNGYINKEPLINLLPNLDAVKIDLKAFNDETYRELIGGRLEPVQETIKTIHDQGKWLELVYLIVPGHTDNLDEIKQMCIWIKQSVGSDVPLHFSRFWPKYKLLNLPPTPEEIIKEARQVCIDMGLKYVYTGNIDDEIGGITYCPTNNQPVIQRQGYFIKEILVDKEGKSSICPVSLPGVWQ